MNRSNFLKSLATFIAAPSIVKDFEVNEFVLPPIETLPKEDNYIGNVGIFYPEGSNGKLISDLNNLTPGYYKGFVDKYGDEKLFKEYLTAFIKP